MAEKRTAKMRINYEAEQALLASIMMDAEVAAEYAALLYEDDFALPQNKLVFGAIKELLTENKAVDSLTVGDKLSLKNKLAEAGGMEYLTDICAKNYSAALAEDYFEIVKRESLVRSVIAAGNSIVKTGYETESGMDALNYAERVIFGISESNESSKLKQIKEAAAEVYKNISDMQLGQYVDNGIKTGYSNLDKKIDSIKPGSLCILAARPSVGKTAFALTIAMNAAVAEGKKVAIFSFEMPTVQLVQRMTTTLSGISIKRQKKTGMLSRTEVKKIYDSFSVLSGASIYVDDNASNTPSSIISKCRRMKNTVGLDLVIVDYLQLITLGEKSKKENRQAEVADMSRSMKLFAKELNVPFIVLSQLSRISEQNKEEPQLSSLRESGAIEQDADMVMFLHRPIPVENPKSDEALFTARYPNDGSRRFIKLLVAKNRNGEIGNCYFEFDGDTQSYKPIHNISTPPTAATINPDVTKLEHIGGNPDAAFAGMQDETKKGSVEEIVDDVIQPIKEPPFDTSTGDMHFAKNESGDQSIDELPF